MPVTKSARKKVRKDKKRTALNRNKKLALKETVKAARKKPTLETLRKAYSYLDKAAKTHLIHKNKASRLKSRLARLVKLGIEEKPTQGKKVRKKVRKIKRKSEK